MNNNPTEQVEAPFNNGSNFPAGLRVLAVDDDRVFLFVLEKMLRVCQYEVTKCVRGEDALSILRENKSKFDLVLCDLHMPNIDGLKLLEIIASETDLPVIMMSEDDRREAVMNGVVRGACDFLVKPICIKQLGVIWQHVVRKKRQQNCSSKEKLEQATGIVEQDREGQVNQSNYADNISRTSEGNAENLKRINHDNEGGGEEEEEEEEGEANHECNGTKHKKPRIIWSPELHQKFVEAVQQLGVEKAVPKKILECMQQMDVPPLTRENVASHLQKFRLYIRRRTGESQEHSGNSSPLYCPRESANFEQSCSSAALAAQLPLGIPYGCHTNSSSSNIALPLHDQRKFLDPVMMPQLGYEVGTQLRQVNLHGGVSTQLGYESKPSRQPVVQQMPLVMNFQGGTNLGLQDALPASSSSSFGNPSYIYSHPLSTQMSQMFPTGHHMSNELPSGHDQGVPVPLNAPSAVNIYNQNRELGNTIVHDQSNNLLVDDATMIEQRFGHNNGNLCGPFMKDGAGVAAAVGGGVLSSQQDSNSDSYLYLYDIDNAFFQDTP